MASLTEILKKAEDFNSIIQDRHSIRGLVLPTLVLPSVGRGDYQSGNYENCAIWTGVYVAAQSLRYAATGDLQAREQARAGLQALHKLQDVTGELGLIARGYKDGNAKTWDEDFFWEKRGRHGDEWHQNDSGQRWLGDPSKSQIFGVVFGYFAFYQFCNPDEQEKKKIGLYLSNIVNRIIKNEMMVIDKDGQVSNWGNYSPKQYLGFGGIGPFLMLSKLKLAANITGLEIFKKEYQRLIYGKEYLRFLERCRPNFPVLKQLSTSFGSEDNLAMLNYYMLMHLEDNGDVLSKCKKGLEKRWKIVNDPENVLFNFIYHALAKTETPDLEAGVKALHKFPTEKSVPLIALKRKLPDSKRAIVWNIASSRRMSIEERPADEYLWRVNPFRHDKWRNGREGIMEFTGVDFLIAAYMGLHHNFIG